MLRRAVDLDPRGAAWAVRTLAGQLARRGRQEEAEAVLRQALASDDPNLAAGASLDLAKLFARDVDEEEAAYRRIMEEGEPEAAAGAASWLASLLNTQGRADEAEAVLRRAIDLDPRDASWAMHRLGRLVAQGGRNHEEAEALLRQAMDSDDPFYGGGRVA